MRLQPGERQNSEILFRERERNTFDSEGTHIKDAMAANGVQLLCLIAAIR